MWRSRRRGHARILGRGERGNDLFQVNSLAGTISYVQFIKVIHPVISGISSGIKHQFCFNHPTFHLQVWLLGYEVTDTVIVITKNKSVQFLTSQKKAQFLSPLKSVAPFPTQSPCTIPPSSHDPDVNDVSIRLMPPNSKQLLSKRQRYSKSILLVT